MNIRIKIKCTYGIKIKKKKNVKIMDNVHWDVLHRFNLTLLLVSPRMHFNRISYQNLSLFNS